MDDKLKITQPNKSSALIALGTAKMTDGEIYKISYVNSFGKTDCLVALGIGEGVGPDYYTILSDGGDLLVTKIVDTLPDISVAVFGAVYLLKDEGKIWRCHLSEDGGVWKKEEILGDHMVSVSEDGSRYFLTSGKLVTPGEGGGGTSSFQIISDQATYTIPIPSSPKVGGE